ncbi:uncharacterized protein HKW66_Vig0231880 [Vigna angularis]|uniref:Uncharacterized protein n=1 Tax=Phaseolus angularis TaxID=3914 RepID=A0A8T0KDF8_PHAAN|nr:uncharacterized protein HKW66_Vig0231880 [Vigna angularis]
MWHITLKVDCVRGIMQKRNIERERERRDGARGDEGRRERRLPQRRSETVVAGAPEGESVDRKTVSPALCTYNVDGPIPFLAHVAYYSESGLRAWHNAETKYREREKDETEREAMEGEESGDSLNGDLRRWWSELQKEKV